MLLATGRGALRSGTVEITNDTPILSKKKEEKKRGKKSFACKFEPASSMNPNLLETERVNPTLSNEIGPGSNFQSNLKFFENVKKFPRLKASHDLYPSGSGTSSELKPSRF